MPAWYAAIPILGTFIESLGTAIDGLVTSDEERLALKAKITETIVPVLTAVLDAERHANDLRAKIIEIEAKAEDRFVRWRRPILSLLGTLHGCAGMWLYLAGALDYQAFTALLTFGGALGGLDIASRGIEKTLDAFRAREK
jgi:hypothetical protein